MAAFVGAGALADNATVPTQAIASHASTAVGDILIAQIYNKAASNVTSPPDGTWTKIIEALNSTSHQYTLFWKRATVAGAQSYTFTKATDDNNAFGGVISTWRVTGIDATTRGVTATTTANTNVTFPAFDPTSTVAHIVYFAFYGDDATNFTTMPASSGLTLCYDLETATGTDASLACCSINSDGSAYAGRTWGSFASVTAPNTGVVLGLTFLETVAVTQATVSVAGKTVTVGDGDVAPVTKATVTVTGKTVTLVDLDIIPVLKATISLTGQSVTIADISAPGNNDVRFSSTRTSLNVRRTLLYRPLTASIRVTATDTVPVTQATITVTGKTVTLVEREITPVLKADVTVTGKTVTGLDTGADTTAVTSATVTFVGQTVTTSEPISDLIPQAETGLLARWTLLYRPLTEPIPFPPDIVSVAPAAVTITGQTVAIGEGTSSGNNDVRFASAATTLRVRRSLIYRSLTIPSKPPGVADTTTVTQATVTYTGKTVTLVDREVTPVLKATVTVTGKTVTVRDADVTAITKASISLIGKLVSELETIPINKGTVTFAGQTIALVDPGVDRITVEKADVLFSGQTVLVTDTGVPIQPPPIGGGGGVPPWIDYGRKHRRRYRALEEIEKRLDKRIETLKTETKKTQEKVAEVLGGQTGEFVPDLFGDLLRQQALITGMLLEAQRRAEAVRQERIQLAILAQRAAEAIDEEEAITMLLLT